VTPRCAVGIDVGGTKVLGAIVDERGQVLADHRVPSPKSWPDMRAVMIDLARELGGRGHEIEGVGVGAAGLVDLDGAVHYAPNVPGFRKVAVRAELAEALDLPVVVDNDANTAAFAELKLGAARGWKDAIVVTLGTGIGGGAIVNGAILRGAHGFAAEFGHFQVDPAGPWCACGERGHWESIASGTALGRMAREAAEVGRAPAVLAAAGGDATAITGIHVSEAARTGARDALDLVDRFAFNVAVGLAGLANILDPGVIAIGGGIVKDGDLFLGPIRRHFLAHIEGAEYRAVPDVVAAQVGERAGVVGAGLLALETHR
jgi:glucokinase